MSEKAQSREKPRDRVRAEATQVLIASAFPIQFYREWKEDCKQNFGDCHWIKAWNDHQNAKVGGRYDRLEERILELERKVVELSSKPKKDEDGFVETMTAKVKKGGD